MEILAKGIALAGCGIGAGLAASIGKVGAVLGVFFIPVLLKAGGASLVLIVSAAVMLAGGLVTDIFHPRHISNAD